MAFLEVDTRCPIGRRRAREARGGVSPCRYAHRFLAIYGDTIRIGLLLRLQYTCANFTECNYDIFGISVKVTQEIGGKISLQSSRTVGSLHPKDPSPCPKSLTDWIEQRHSRRTGGMARRLQGRKVRIRPHLLSRIVTRVLPNPFAKA